MWLHESKIHRAGPNAPVAEFFCRTFRSLIESVALRKVRAEGAFDWPGLLPGPAAMDVAEAVGAIPTELNALGSRLARAADQKMPKS
jgi:hypothetical protein